MAQLTQDFFQVILAIEGGYQNRSDDNGNYNICGQLVGTNMGVSAVAYSQWVGRCPSEAEMRAITQQTAYNFYAWYFDRYNCFRIENQQLAELIMQNTMGSPAGAARAEQRALNRLGYPVAIDGARGAQTLQALNTAAQDDLPALYNTIREEWIRHLEAVNKPQFLPAWMHRLDNYFPPLTPLEESSQAAVLAIPLLLGLGWALTRT